jgi:hypothetical protein
MSEPYVSSALNAVEIDKTTGKIWWKLTKPPKKFGGK